MFVNVANIKDESEFNIIPTSNKSILKLEAFPGAINTFYDWLEGVDVFSSILFDMNELDMYIKWGQVNQGQYHVQKAQYLNCVFWSDLPYIQPLETRNNYTLYNSFQLPLCYSRIPENTFKAFYCAYGVSSDPNWSNSRYLDSFAASTIATQVWSYYNMHTIGIYNMDASYFNIKLPKDCRGLCFYAVNIKSIGVLDASITTNFGAKKGSWQDAFGYCYTLEDLYIKNLKTSINVSWSPINQHSLNFILENAINTSKITIYLSPYTYYRLTDENVNLAAEKNITLTLLEGNYIDDKRFKNIPTSTSQLVNDSGYITTEEVNSMLATLINRIEALEQHDENQFNDWK